MDRHSTPAVSECPETPGPQTPPHSPPVSECPEPPQTPPRTPPRRASEPIVQPTPNHNRASGSRLFTSSPKINATANKNDMYRETHKYFLGPMPVGEFLDTFLPTHGYGTRSNRSSKGLDLELNEKWNHEKYLYRPLITAFSKLRLGNLRFNVTAHSGDPDWVVGGLAPDISAYHKDNWTTNFRRRQLKPDTGVGSQDADFVIMELPVEVKWRTMAYDPFVDPSDGADLTKHNFVKDDQNSQSVIGQLCSYATAQMGMGFRTHCFSIFIVRDTARLIRWDRAGAVVTRSFKYIKISWLADFLKRYDRLSPAQRGWDQTAIPLSLDDPETIKARDALIQERFTDETEEEFQDRSSHFQKATFYKFLVQDLQKGPEPGPLVPKAYIGPFPRRWACSLVGRNSRGSPVYNPENGEIHWLKDTWRIDMRAVVIEHVSYAKMEKCKVRNLIPVVAAGDMRELDGTSCVVQTDLITFSDTSDAPSPTSGDAEQVPTRGPTYNSVHCTATDKLIGQSWVCGDKMFFWRNMIGYCHYRILLLKVGRDLTSFPSTTVLLQSVSDALISHHDALFNAEILHRDISPGNILIMNDNTGSLIDWELCRHGDQGQSHRPGRTGTWQFISGSLLQSPKTKVHDVVDDLESFLHALTFTLVRYSSSSFSPEELLDFLEMFDEEKPHTDGKPRGGKLKALNLASGLYVTRLDFPGRPRLRELLKDFAQSFGPVYREPTEQTELEVQELRTREGGVQKISQKIIELLEQIEVRKDWSQNPKSKKVDIPFVTETCKTITGKRSRSSNERVPTQPISYKSSTSILDAIPEGPAPDERQDEDKEGDDRGTKRIRSDVQID